MNKQNKELIEKIEEGDEVKFERWYDELQKDEGTAKIIDIIDALGDKTEIHVNAPKYDNGAIWEFHSDDGLIFEFLEDGRTEIDIHLKKIVQ